MLQLADWDQEKTYDEEPPCCIHYSIEWKVIINNKVVSDNTEQDLVLAPASYWQLFLQPNLAEVLRRKASRNRNVRCDDTKVMVSVTGRSERPFKKTFRDTEIDWSVVEKKFTTWGELFRGGKKLRVDLSFNFMEVGPQSANRSSKTGDKRGSSSTTKRMLEELDTQIDAEEESLGQPSIWRDVYSLMRCPGPPCKLGFHCWRDPAGKKHYPLKSHHLQSLIEHVHRGSPLRTHDDVPEAIRRQLYDEERQRLDRKQKDTAASSLNLPPITITNVLPGQSQQTPLPALQGDRTTSIRPSNSTPVSPLDVPGYCDDVVREYADYQESKVRDATWKLEVQKARDAVLADGLDLKQLYAERDYDYLEQNGVKKKGVRMRFIDDIPAWVKRRKSELV